MYGPGCNFKQARVEEFEKVTFFKIFDTQEVVTHELGEECSDLRRQPRQITGRKEHALCVQGSIRRLLWVKK